MTSSAPKDSPTVVRARELAHRAHADHRRKSGDVPYVVHLEGVAERLREHGYGDDTTQAAALLHDLVEDRPAFEGEMRALMPPDVVETVLALTEVKIDADGRRKAKAERFDGYVRGLASGSEAARRALPVSCADKIDNFTSLIESEAKGESLLMKLATRPAEHLEQAARLRELYAGAVAPSLLGAFDQVVGRLKETISRWLPGRAALVMAEAHLGQFDRAGQPYVLHPMRLGLQASGRDEQMAALLHDVVEDGGVALETLRREGFPSTVLRAVDALTRRGGETYEEFVERVARDRVATRVKLLDLAHNADLSRLPSPTDADRERAAKYRRAIVRLENELERRNLYVRLDDECRARVRARARLPVPRAEHVTLARRVLPAELGPTWVPGGYPVGAPVELRAVAACVDDRVEAWVVEMGGTTVRPVDGGTLHLTVSRAPEARSHDANALLASAAREPLDEVLTGTVEWVDE